MNRIPKLPGVYIIRNLVNGKEYVGQATNLWARWQKHKQEFANGTHDNPHLVNSWRKYGKENFEFIPLVICERAELTRYEQGILDRRKCAYNICRVAVQSCLGVRHSLEARAHMSAAQKKLAGIQSRRMKELWASPEYRLVIGVPDLGVQLTSNVRTYWQLSSLRNTAKNSAQCNWRAGQIAHLRKSWHGVPKCRRQ